MEREERMETGFAEDGGTKAVGAEDDVGSDNSSPNARNTTSKNMATNKISEMADGVGPSRNFLSS